jgi:hypothetical protein
VLPVLVLALTAAICCTKKPSPTPGGAAAPGGRIAPATVPTGASRRPPALPALDAATAGDLAALSLACVDREYPNKPGSVVDGDDAVVPPRLRTPAFFGCFDWHSAVHGHWTMTAILRRFPETPRAAAIRDALDRHLAPDRITAEVAFFGLPRNRTFERPYGWAWLLRLAAELHGWDDEDAGRWREALVPLADLLAQRTTDYLDRLSVPCREGTHQNTAFALAHVLDWARTTGNEVVAAAVAARARDFYLADRQCPVVYEPSGEDFVSPCLAEADLMRRALPPDAFATWLDGFLPDPASDAFAPLRRPAEIRDPEDPRIGHLIGLSFHRAWTMKGIADALDGNDPHRALLHDLASIHLASGLETMAGSGYGGEHWLASFALFARIVMDTEG